MSIFFRVPVNWYEFAKLSPSEQLGAFREWLFDNDRLNDARLLLDQGRPIWIFLMEIHAWDSLHEFIKQEQAQSTLNARDRDGRGWCHHCIYNAAPDALSVEGFYSLDASWNDSDHYGNTPMNAFPTPTLAQAMARRWWNEHVDVAPAKKATHFRQLAEQVRDPSHAPLKRIWAFWGRGFSPKTLALLALSVGG